MSNLSNDDQEELEKFFDNSSREISDYLSRAIPLLKDLPGTLRSSDPMAGLQSIAQATEGLTLILEYLQAAQNLSFQDNNAGKFAMFEKNLTEVIIQMAAAMEQQDTGLMADVVEYELIERLDELHQEIKKIIT